MLNPIHPLCGQDLVVRHVTQFGDIRVLVAEHPAGGVITLPESEISAPASRPDALFDGQSIRSLVSRVSELARR